MTSWLRLTCVCACMLLSARADSKLDYLQPYKFVKPLDDLGDIFSVDKDKKAVEEEEEDLPVAAARTGEAAPLESELMSTSLSAPEPVVKADKLVSNKSRARKTSSDDFEKEDESRMSNHNTADEPKEAVAEARTAPLRSRLPPRPEDEYYYYYDDEYYYDDYYPSNYKAPSRKPEKYPNFPSKPAKTSPKKQAPKDTKEKVDKSKYDRPLHRDIKHKESKHKPIRPKPVKPVDHFRRPAASYFEKKEDRRDYNIHSTINRLKGLRDNHVHRAGKPSLPNPWEKFNLPPKSRPDTRLQEDKKKLAVSNSKIRKTVKPLPDYDYRDEMYYYDDPQPLPVQPIRRNGGYGGGGANPLALLVAPLAGIALLTAAAAVAINPVLVTVSLTGKRRKRSAEPEEGISPELEEKIHEMKVLENFMASIPENENYQHQVLSMYLSCSGYTEVGNTCIDRVVCEYADPSSEISTEERDVISIVLYNIMSNKFVTAEYKDRLRLAAKHGRDDGKCLVFECEELTSMDSNSL